MAESWLLYQSILVRTAPSHVVRSREWERRTAVSQNVHFVLCYSVLIVPVFLEECQINRVAHRGIPGIVRVEIVAAIERRPDMSRVTRVAHDRIKVNDCVEHAAGADPGV